MPFPRIRLFRKAHAAVSSVDYLYAAVRANGTLRKFLAYTPNLKPGEQIVRLAAESPDSVAPSGEEIRKGLAKIDRIERIVEQILDPHT